MKFWKTSSLVVALVTGAGSAFAACDPGEVVIKFSHVTNPSDRSIL